MPSDIGYLPGDIAGAAFRLAATSPCLLHVRGDGITATVAIQLHLRGGSFLNATRDLEVVLTSGDRIFRELVKESREERDARLMRKIALDLAKTYTDRLGLPADDAGAADIAAKTVIGWFRDEC